MINCLPAPSRKLNEHSNLNPEVGERCRQAVTSLQRSPENDPMYLRFQTKAPDPNSGRPTGILVAAHALRDSNRVSIEDEAWLREYLSYFNQHLKIPPNLKDDKNRRAISWFKEGSGIIDRVWNLKVFLEEQDIFIDVVTTREPGAVIYEDGHQIVAKPNRNT